MGGVSAFSPQTDIYSLGATLYYLVSGTVPPQAAIVANEGLPELPVTISANVRTAIEKAMEFRSKQRPESIAILKQLLGNKVVSAPVSAQPSADTVIDIVEDNSATQIDGGATQIDVPKDDATQIDVPKDVATQIDVPKDDATQIDGSSETAIEPKPQPEPKVAPKPQHDIKHTEPRIEARHIPRIDKIVDAIDGHFAKVLESGIERNLNSTRGVYTAIYIDNKKVFTINSISNRIGAFVIHSGNDKVSKRMLHLRNSNPNYIYTPGRENIIGNNSEKLIDVICEVMDGVNADIKYSTYLSYSSDIRLLMNILFIFLTTCTLFMLLCFWWIFELNIIILLLYILFYMWYNKVMYGQFSLSFGAPKK